MNNNIGKVIYEMIKYNNKDTKRINHALKVYAISKCIISCETNDDSVINTTLIAAIMHDIGIHVCEDKYNSCAGKYQELEGPIVTKKLLSEFHLKESILDRVLYLIAHHHTYTNIDGLDYQVLVEADFIVNLEEENSSRESILAASKNIFKTGMGISILNSMLT